MAPDPARWTFAAFTAGLGLWTIALLVGYDAPFIDLPAHAFNLAVLRNPALYGDRFVDQLVPWTTNSPWFWLDKLFLKHVTTESVSLALAFAAAIIALPLATAAWAKELGRDWVVAGLIAWWTAWSGMVYWGFFHYSQGIALSVLVLAWDRAHQRDGTGSVRLGALWVVLFLVHMQAWAWTAVLVVLQRAAHGLRLRAKEGVLPFLPSTVLAVVWVVSNLARAQGSADMGTLEGGLGLKWQSPFRTVNEMVALMSASFPWTFADDVLAVLLLLGGLVGFFWAYWEDEVESALKGALFVGLGTFAGMLVLPAQMQGQFFLSVRLVAFLPPAAAVLMSPRLQGDARRLLLGVAGIGAIGSMVMNHQALERFQSESAPAYTLMEQIPSGQRVLFWPANRHSDAAHGGIYTHITGWYATRNQGEPNFSFAVFRPNPVVYRDPANHPHTRAGWENRPWCTALAGEARDFDYLLVRGLGPQAHCSGRTLYRDQLEAVATENGWGLYRITDDLPALPKGDCRCPGL